MHPRQRLGRRARGALRGAWLVGLLLALPHLAAPAVGHSHPSPGGGSAGHPIIRVVRVGLAPGLLAVDTRTQRVFVLNDATNSGGDSIGPATVSVLEATSGALVRTVAVGQNPSYMVVDAQTGRVFVTSMGPMSATAFPPYPAHGRVRVLDAANGSLLHTISVGSEPTALAVDQRTRHVFVINGGALSVLNADNGHLLHTVPILGVGAGNMAVDEQTGRVYITSYGSDRMEVCDADSGRVLRTIRVGDHVNTVAVDVSLNRVFAINDNNQFGYVEIFTTTGGTPLRMTTVGNAPGQLIIGARMGRVFVLNTNSVSTLDARSGALLHTAAVDHFQGQTGGMALDAGAGRLYVTSNRGLLVLDARSGALLGTVPVGAAAGAIAVDARSRHVFIADSAHNSVTILDAARLP